MTKNCQYSTMALIMLSVLLVACGPTANTIQSQPTVTIPRSFQSSTSPVPTVPLYRCGAWASNNAPNLFSTISIYARLTKDITGVQGATAQAVAHFQGEDVTLDQQPTSDKGGYVTFTLQLQGRQPGGVPTTVDVSFNAGKQTVQCTPAFFTPH